MRTGSSRLLRIFIHSFRALLGQKGKAALAGDSADLFEQLKAAALDDLNKAVTACQSVGIPVTLNIEEL